MHHISNKDALESYLNPGGNMSELSAKTKDMSTAINSLREELEAIDLYQQRIDLCEDEALKGVLAHNRDEEKEHAAMLIEWLRRQDAAFDHELRDYLFSDKALSH